MYSRHYVFGIDVGAMHLPTAIAIIEQEARHDPTGWESVLTELRLRHLERISPDDGYPELAARVRFLVKALEDKEQCERPDVLVDMTGTGRAPVDLIEQQDIPTIPVLITTGTEISQTPESVWRLAKIELVGTLNALMQEGTLKMSEGLELVATLKEELQNFKMKPPTLKPDDGEAWREGQFDDLVFAVGIACWWAKKEIPSSKDAIDAQTRRAEETLRKQTRNII